ncbi:rhodanese-like domain-containing protein [Marinoscillum sp.]|uniref:rhodanese-like domain-containing protein n=1 Tax=Marinoscillum sp. TaxID=2024838 RepID=UPI003BAB0D65
MFGLFKTKPKNYQNVNVEEFKELKKKSRTVVLDVRTPQEKAEGTVPGAHQINYFNPNFKNQVAKLDKSKTYLVYCRSGNRSKKACAMMGSMGFEKLYNLNGGIMAWNRDN